VLIGVDILQMCLYLFGFEYLLVLIGVDTSTINVTKPMHGDVEI